MIAKKLAIVSVALAGVLAAATVEARGRDDVQFSVTIGSPAWSVHPVPVFAPPIVVRSHDHRYSRPSYAYGHPHYGARTRWDRDGDGIPNRYDPRYTPRWDRDGDGIPNRYDRHPNRGDGRGSRW
jgi:hypothetical protein